MSEGDRPFSFLRTNVREGKPRQHGVTEISGPYYTADVQAIFGRYS
jgi:hypothetical protein